MNELPVSRALVWWTLIETMMYCGTDVQSLSNATSRHRDIAAQIDLGHAALKSLHPVCTQIAPRPCVQQHYTEPKKGSTIAPVSITVQHHLGESMNHTVIVLIFVPRQCRHRLLRVCIYISPDNVFHPRLGPWQLSPVACTRKFVVKVASSDQSL
jgi:hypothetical protein